MKRALLLFGVLLSLGIFCACSSDDEIDNDLSVDNLTNGNDSAADKIQFSFSLLNNDGLPTSSFKYGEDISFDLTITNKSDKELFLFNDFFLSEDLFRVYLEDGTGVGAPWTDFNSSNYVALGIAPKSAISFTCNWIKALSTQWPLVKNKDFDPLPKGNYYTKFKIKYRNLDNIPQDEFLEKEFCITFTIQ
jgi:hypothetical protein